MQDANTKGTEKEKQSHCYPSQSYHDKDTPSFSSQGTAGYPGSMRNDSKLDAMSMRSYDQTGQPGSMSQARDYGYNNTTRSSNCEGDRGSYEGAMPGVH